MQIQEQNQKDIMNAIESPSVKSECCGIYGLRNKINGKWYIGQSADIEKRWLRAYKRLDCKKQRKIYAALQKYGYDNFDKIVLEKCLVDHLDDREEHWVKHYDCVENGYNCTEGGRGGNLSAETRRLMSNAQKIKPTTEKMILSHKNRLGTKATDETRRKMSLSHTGKKLSEMQKEKIGFAHRGMKRKEGSGKNISESLKDRTIYKFVNNFLGLTFSGIRTEFVSMYPEVKPQEIYSIIKKKRKTCKGWSISP